MIHAIESLSPLAAAHHLGGPRKAAALGLLVGAGLAAAREGTNALFGMRTSRLFAIVAGHDAVLRAVQGAIPGGLALTG